MSAAEDQAAGEEFLATSRRATQARAMLSAALLTLGFVASFADNATDDEADGYLYGSTNQSAFTVPNGGWITCVNVGVGGTGPWTTGAVTVTVFVTRGEGEAEEEVEVVAFDFTPGEEQDETSLDPFLLEAGDRVHVVLSIDALNTADAPIIASATIGLGLFR